VSELNNQARTAIEAVVRNFSATWNPYDSHVTVAGKRAALQLASVKRLSTSKGNAAKIRLRFDKVATRVITRLQGAAVEIVPEGMTVVVTITAPIRLASKTTSSMEEMIRTILARKRPSGEAKATIHANRVRVRILRNKSRRGPRLLGFVHNVDSDPTILLDLTQEMLELANGPQRKAHRR
jgi:hypothetical protein